MSRIYSRASWGARHQDGVGTRPVGSLQKYLHHSVTRHLPPTATLAQERVQCRVVESIGQQRFGAGISYTFLIFPSGRIHQGASVHRISYHSGGGRDGKPRNTLGVGICLVGNTDTNEMTPQQVAALVWLLQEGVRRGWWNDPAITEAHRDFKSTACPGRHAYKRIAEINRAGRATPVSKPNTPSPGRDWFDMATKEELRAIVRGEIREHRGLQNKQLHTAIQRDLKTTAEQIVTQTFARIMGDVHPKGIGSDFRGTAVEISKDTAAMRAIVEQLPGMIAALEAGESFDQDKFIAGFQDTLARTLQEAIEVSGEVRIAALPSIELEPPLEGTEED